MHDRLVPICSTCAIALASAASVVLARKVVHVTASLLVHSLALAALYLLLSAEMVAMGQVIVYAGAIVVLFLFVVLLLPQGGKEPAPRVGYIAVALALGAMIFTPVVLVLSISNRAAQAPEFDGDAAAIGRVLFGSQFVPFELTAGLLLVAIIGAVALWRRQGVHP